MKYSTALTLFLACGPSAIMAAPVAQGVAPALGLRNDGPPAQASPQAAPAGSSASGMKGQKAGNEGTLDKVKEILEDLEKALRKRGAVEELGDTLKKTLDSSSGLLNGQSQGAGSTFSESSSDPDGAVPAQDPEASPEAAGGAGGAGAGGAAGGAASFLGGRSNPLDTVTNGASSVPKEALSLTHAAPVKRSFAPQRDDHDEHNNHHHHDDHHDDHHDNHHDNPQSSPEAGLPSGLPTNSNQLSPQQIAALVGLLNTPAGAQQKSPIPGQ